MALTEKGSIIHTESGEGKQEKEKRQATDKMLVFRVCKHFLQICKEKMHSRK